MKVLYVDALSAPTALQNTQGIHKSYARKHRMSVFDYRKIYLDYTDTETNANAQRKMNQDLYKQAVEFKPHLIHLGKCEFILGDTIKRIKKTINTFVVHYYGDYNEEGPPEWVKDIGLYADYTLLCHKIPKYIKEYKEHGVENIGYWQPGIDPDNYKHPGKCDIIIIGNNSDYRRLLRRQILEALDETKYNVHLYGKNWNQDDYKNIKVKGYLTAGSFFFACSYTKIILGDNNGINNIPMYASWRRTFNSIATGKLHITSYTPGLEKIFTNKKHLVWFNSVPEMLKLIHYYMVHNKERITIGSTGRKEVLTKLTWDKKTNEIIQ